MEVYPLTLIFETKSLSRFCARGVAVALTELLLQLHSAEEVATLSGPAFRGSFAVFRVDGQ